MKKKFQDKIKFKKIQDILSKNPKGTDLNNFIDHLKNIATG